MQMKAEGERPVEKRAVEKRAEEKRAEEKRAVCVCVRAHARAGLCVCAREAERGVPRGEAAARAHVSNTPRRRRMHGNTTQP